MKIFIHAIIVLVFIALVSVPSLEADTYSIAGDTGDVAFTSGGVNYNHASIGLDVNDELNGLSAGDDQIPWRAYDYFSVAPGSQGLAGTDVRDHFNQGDVEEWLYRSPHSPHDGTNTAYNHRTPGDDLDGYDFSTLGTGYRIYFTIASAGSLNSDTIYTAIIGTPASLAVFADASDLGISSGADLDAISVQDINMDGVYDADDRILFSVDSVTIGANIYCANTLGAVLACSSGDLGLQGGDNMNALENGAPEPSTFVLMGTALLGLMAARRRWRK